MTRYDSITPLHSIVIVFIWVCTLTLPQESHISHDSDPGSKEPFESNNLTISMSLSVLQIQQHKDLIYSHQIGAVKETSRDLNSAQEFGSSGKWNNVEHMFDGKCWKHCQHYLTTSQWRWKISKMILPGTLR